MRTSPDWHLTPGTSFFLPLLCFHQHGRMHLQITVVRSQKPGDRISFAALGNRDPGMRTSPDWHLTPGTSVFPRTQSPSDT